jgi:hypothetical protein
LNLSHKRRFVKRAHRVYLRGEQEIPSHIRQIVIRYLLVCIRRVKEISCAVVFPRPAVPDHRFHLCRQGCIVRRLDAVHAVEFGNQHHCRRQRENDRRGLIDVFTRQALKRPHVPPLALLNIKRLFHVAHGAHGKRADEQQHHAGSVAVEPRKPQRFLQRHGDDIHAKNTRVIQHERNIQRKQNFQKLPALFQRETRSQICR